MIFIVFKRYKLYSRVIYCISEVFIAMNAILHSKVVNINQKLFNAFQSYLLHLRVMHYIREVFIAFKSYLLKVIYIN